MLTLAEVIRGNPQAGADLMEDVVSRIRARGLLRRYWAQPAMLALARIALNDPGNAMPAVREAIKPMHVEGTL